MKGVAFALVLAACGDNVPGEDRQGGAATIDDRTDYAFTHPAPLLAQDELDMWRLGRGPFDFHWVEPQLGPLFNNDACGGCHGGRGRGLSQLGVDSVGSQALIRVSMPDGTGAHGGPMPVPGYGTQLQDHATSGGLPEFRGDLTWREHDEVFGDGETITLRAPFIVMHPLTPFPPGTHMSYRQAPPLIGLGLLDAIDAETLIALEDPDDADGDGISGRLNHVWDDELAVTMIGRFGWKANTSRLRAQVAGAFVNDMGLTSIMFPEPDGSRDVSDDQLVQTVMFATGLAVPAAAPRPPEAWRGRALFDDFHCSGCHLPTLETGDYPIATLAHQTIHPFTDLLLHDMGDLLTDARPDFEADGREWRTPPLWGIGLTQLVMPGATFLHDGRARTLSEAILWHGGEAEAAREAFRMASKRDRDALLAYLATL